MQRGLIEADGGSRGLRSRRRASCGWGAEEKRDVGGRRKGNGFAEAGGVAEVDLADEVVEGIEGVG